MITPPPPPDSGPAVERLAKALNFICGANHPATVAARKAATSGAADDASKARKLFEKLKPSLRQAALVMMEA
ncbi:MAG: hypothetical protein EXQ94_02040 [Alphaproteobacteria bacterium]|nr:hypothetical protein [Alphaproteobacteria bacterium]